MDSTYKINSLLVFLLYNYKIIKQMCLHLHRSNELWQSVPIASQTHQAAEIQHIVFNKEQYTVLPKYESL